MSNLVKAVDLLQHVVAVLSEHLAESERFDFVLGIYAYRPVPRRVGAFHEQFGIAADVRGDGLLVEARGMLFGQPVTWPYSDHTIQEYGYDAREMSLVSRTTTDLMNYSMDNREPVWLSPYTFGRLFPAQSPSALSQRLGEESTKAFAVVGGTVDTSDNTELYGARYDLPLRH